MPQGAILLGREDEERILDELLESARNHTSGALVLYGDAGMGKTALLDYAASICSLSLARISGIETEQAFGFAALHRLLIAMLHELEALPPPQKTALESAFGLLDQAPPDQYMVGLATLTLLARESATSGLLCIIDDAQWIDLESLRTLAFVGRRLRAEGIVFLFGLRTYFDVPSDLAGIPSLEICGLPDDAAAHLLAQAAGRPLTPSAVQRIVTETNGCPLALWELGEKLTETRSDVDRGLEVPLSISRQLEDHFLQQVNSLRPETQLLLLVAAAEITGERAVVRAAAHALGCTDDAENEAQRHRLLLTGPQFRFRHPLIRSAVYAKADPDERRRVHRAIAGVVSKASHPDRWSRHVARGAVGPDEHLAAELEATAEMARARGGYSAQVSLMVQAADLSENLEARSLRLLGAATAAMNAGSHNHAVALLDEADLHLTDPALKAEAQLLRGNLSIRLSQPAAAPALLLAAAELFRPVNTLKAREALLEAFEAYAVSIHFTSDISASDIARVVDETDTGDMQSTLEEHLLTGTARLVGDGPPAALEHYLQAARILREGDVNPDQIARRFIFGLVVANELLDERTHRSWTARVDGYARENGALLVLLFNLFGQMDDDVRAGRLSDASAHHAEALEVAEAVGLPAEYYLPMNVGVTAWAGEEGATRAAAESLIEVASAVGVAVPVIMAYHSLAILHLASGRYQEALEATDYICSRKAIGWTSQTLPLAVEAAVRSGAREKAQNLLAELETRSRASGTPWALGLLARSQALLLESTKAEELFQKAIVHMVETSVATDLAYTRLLYGEWLRREGRRVDARAQLRMARDFFIAMGAQGFVARAENELLATGERAQPRSVAKLTNLSPQERRIAQLAAERLTNPEIAARLFISSATVDYHLRKVFRKLDVSSRRQLLEALRKHGLVSDG